MMKSLQKHRKTSNNSRKENYSKVFDEEITSSEEEEEEKDFLPSEDLENINETAQSKRRRIAKEYLKSIEKRESENYDPVNIAAQLINDRLGIPKLNYILENSDEDSFIESKNFHSAKKPITSVSLSQDDAIIVSGSKDGSVVLWDVETGGRMFLQNTQFNISREVLCVSIFTDTNLIACGGRDNRIKLFDRRKKNGEIHTFDGHRDAVTGLGFYLNSLVSTSLDRCIKMWDLKTMSYLDTMFGHQSGISALDCGSKILTGSVDRTIRLWNTTDDNHNVFRGSLGSVDAIRGISSDSFLSGGQDGKLCLWKHGQKRFTSYVEAAHGLNSFSNVPNWIVSISSILNTNIVCSGSMDGFIRIWKLAENHKIKQVSAISCPGFVNSIAMSNNLIVAGLGREHRFGRWDVLKGNHDKVAIMKIKHSD